jgi:hypothetical protein|tara:strand:- start:162 stop:413 length:252 start_codon:yes stop_codon:yes gene_type:complete
MMDQSPRKAGRPGAKSDEAACRHGNRRSLPEIEPIRSPLSASGMPCFLSTDNEMPLAAFTFLKFGTGLALASRPVIEVWSAPI